MTFFWSGIVQDSENQTMHLYQEFPGVPPGGNNNNAVGSSVLSGARIPPKSKHRPVISCTIPS